MLLTAYVVLAKGVGMLVVDAAGHIRPHLEPVLWRKGAVGYVLQDRPGQIYAYVEHQRIPRVLSMFFE